MPKRHRRAFDEPELVCGQPHFYAAATLVDADHWALQASSGAQALQVLGQNHVDVVITDFVVPGMT